MGLAIPEKASLDLSNDLFKKTRPTQRAPDPRKSTGTIVVGVCAFSGSLCGLELVPSKWRYLIPPTSGYPLKGAYASRWATK